MVNVDKLQFSKCLKIIFNQVHRWPEVTNLLGISKAALRWVDKPTRKSFQILETPGHQMLVLSTNLGCFSKVFS